MPIYMSTPPKPDYPDITIENGDITTVVELDGREIARTVTPMVSQDISKDKRRRVNYRW